VASHPNLLFALRVLPAAGSLVVVFLVAAPAFWIFEPYETVESISPGMAITAAVTTMGIAFVLFQAARMLVFHRRLTAQWTRSARPLQLEGIPISAYRLDSEFPLLAIAGIFRPRLLVANRLLESMSREQLAAALAHESGHLAARDNLRRFLLCM